MFPQDENMMYVRNDIVKKYNVVQLGGPSVPQAVQKSTNRKFASTDNLRLTIVELDNVLL